MPRESRKKVSYVEPDDDDDDLVASSPEKPTKKRLVKSKDVAPAEGAMSLAGTAKAGSKGPKQLKNGLWVQDEEESRELLPSVDHSEALRHPFPVLVAPERLAVDAVRDSMLRHGVAPILNGPPMGLPTAGQRYSVLHVLAPFLIREDGMELQAQEEELATRAAAALGLSRAEAAALHRGLVHSISARA